MADSYKHDSGGVTSVISSLNSSIESYRTEIENLTTLVQEISTSSAWKDADIKTSFIATCNSYISVFSGLLNAMESYTKYLSAKSAHADSIEAAFSRW